MSSGNVYFDVEAYGAHRYKKLASHYMEPGKRDLEKKNPEDFALWKAHKPDEPWWHSPWGRGKGRPGWHIECSVMSRYIEQSSDNLESLRDDCTFAGWKHQVEGLQGGSTKWKVCRVEVPSGRFAWWK